MEVSVEKLKIDGNLYTFINDTLLDGLAVSPELFWKSLSDTVHDIMPENQALLATRDRIQQQIDDWYQQHPNHDMASYKTFLADIGYLESSPDNFRITTTDIDPEIATLPGPQLVVPVDNARYAINAVNARWGSLFDALYGTDMIADAGDTAVTKAFNPARGKAVFAKANIFLDQSLPLEGASHRDVTAYKLVESTEGMHLVCQLQNGSSSSLKQADQLTGYSTKANADTLLLFKNNGLHIELHIDAQDAIGKLHPAHVKDVVLESAISSILDLEDSVAAVNAQDKINCYRNLLGLFTNSLTTEFTKGNKTFTRSLAEDRQYKDTQGKDLTLSGRCLMIVRNVGIHMMTNAVHTDSGKQIPEGILDAFCSAIIALQEQRTARVNGRLGSFYIVKPKMHGSAEVMFTVSLFSRIETAFGLKKNCLKIGVMDEERRTSVNLKACIRAAKDRIIFINTGFLDRTGDEIHTSMKLGAFLPKEQLKSQKWLSAYENANVHNGLTSGFSGRAQIGKGMWAIPDQMQAMVDSKIAHPQAGANCAWVPSPTAATLHAIHYHQVDVLAIQRELTVENRLDDILSVPLCQDTTQLSDKEIQQELDNNIQSILGYVVRWVDAGIGCSKVLNIHGVALMEDRATLRISSQHVGNWLFHGVCSEQQVNQTLRRMAEIVDQQNAKTPGYQNMAPVFDGPAFLAAKALIFEAAAQPNGYSEFILNKYRLQAIELQAE